MQKKEKNIFFVMSSPYLVMESTPTLVMSSVVETSLQGDLEISPCAALSRDDIGKWKLSRDDKVGRST